MLVLGRNKHLHKGASFGDTRTFFNMLRAKVCGRLLPVNSFQDKQPYPFKESEFVPPFPSMLLLLSL
jgi:hypothetical protein